MNGWSSGVEVDPKFVGHSLSSGIPTVSHLPLILHPSPHLGHWDLCGDILVALVMGVGDG